MNVAIMAGGKGTRMGNLEKPVLKLGSKDLIQHVIESVEKSDHQLKYICLSKNVPKTSKKYLNDPRTIELLGKSYHQDLKKLIEKISKETIVLQSDTPLIKPKTINKIAQFQKRYKKAIIILVSTLYKKRKGFTTTSQKAMEPAGANTVLALEGPQPSKKILYNTIGTACNINTKKDLKIAKKWFKKQEKKSISKP